MDGCVIDKGLTVVNEFLVDGQHALCIRSVVKDVSRGARHERVRNDDRLHNIQQVG